MCKLILALRAYVAFVVFVALRGVETALETKFYLTVSRLMSTARQSSCILQQRSKTVASLSATCWQIFNEHAIHIMHN